MLYYYKPKFYAKEFIFFYFMAHHIALGSNNKNCQYFKNNII
jgi:hypothetical protein